MPPPSPPRVFDTSLGYRPRTSLDIRVGKHHTIQVLLHLRKTDWNWYKKNADNITAEFQELLQERVLPRVVGTEVEDYYRARHPGVLPPAEDELGGSKKIGLNHKKGSKKQRDAPSKGKGKKAVDTGIATANKKLPSKVTKKRKIRDEEGDTKKIDKDVYFSFGDMIQLSYRREPALSCRTVYFKSAGTDGADNETAKQNGSKTDSPFRDYRRLSHRLLVWISKVDPDQKTNPDPKGVGFYRPEMIPISNLFRQPADLELDDN